MGTIDAWMIDAGESGVNAVLVDVAAIVLVPVVWS